MTLEEEVRELAKFAKAASAKLAQATTEERNGALYAMAAALRAQAPAIVEANGEDMEAARAAGTTEALLDRLMLDESRVFATADALEEVATLPDPLGVVSLESTLYNGIELRRVSVPLGVVAMVYEARPNVTADAAGVCVKSGNACILRGGSLAARSNEVIADVLAAAAVEAGLPEGSICAVTTTDRAATDVLMGCTAWWTCSSPGVARALSAIAWSMPKYRSSRRARATATCTCTPPPTPRWPAPSSGTRSAAALVCATLPRRSWWTRRWPMRCCRPFSRT